MHVHRVAPNGCTEPIECEVSVHFDPPNFTRRAFVKYPNNLQGNRILVNELVSGLLAIELQLPIAPFGLAILSDPIIHANSHILNEDTEQLLHEEHAGVCFFSERLNKTSVLSGDMKLDILATPTEMLEIMMFDHLIYNKDRNAGNLLANLSKKHKGLYIIDHTHAFKNQCVWDQVSLSRQIRDKDYMDKDILEYNGHIYDKFIDTCARCHGGLSLQKLENIAEKFQKSIDENKLSDILLQVPDTWELNEPDATALKDYIMYRVQHLDEIAKMIDTHYKRGGA